jgi:hypothetical protein
MRGCRLASGSCCVILSRFPYEAKPVEISVLWQEFGPAVLSSIGSTTVLGLLLKLWIDARLAKELESHKAALQAQIERTAVEFRRVDSKRADAIERLDAAVRDVLVALDADVSMRVGLRLGEEVMYFANYAPTLASPKAVKLAQRELDAVAIHVDGELHGRVSGLLSRALGATQGPVEILESVPFPAEPTRIADAIDRAVELLAREVDSNVRPDIETLRDAFRERLGSSKS